MRSTSDFSIVGPSKFARYRAGGCEAPSCNVLTQLWIELHGEIEQETRNSGAYHTEADIRQATSIRFMDLYMKDVRSIKDEWSGREVIPADDLLVTEKGVVTRVGDRLVPAEYEFITKRQEKGLEDKAESATLRAALSAITASPEAEVYFPVHNTGKDGTDQIRYIAHWKRSGDRIKTETINVVGDQSDKTLPETHKSIRAIIGRDFTEHMDSSRAYIFTRGVDEGHIRFAKPRVEKSNATHNRIDASTETISRDDVRERYSSPAAANEVYSKATIDTMLTDTVIHVGNKVLHDTKDTAVALGAFVLRRASEQNSDKRRISKKDDRRIARRITDRIRELFSKTPEDKQSEDQPTRLTIEKIREKPVRIGTAIETRHTEMQKSVASLLVVAETKVALGAVPLILATLAKEQPTLIEAAMKSIRRHERKVRRMRKNSEKVQPLKTERVEPLTITKEYKKKKRRVKVRKEIGGKKVAAAEKMTPMGMLKPEKRERKERREKKRLRRAVEKSVGRHKKRELRVKNKELRRIEKREAKKESVKVQPLKTERVEPFKERKQSIQRKEREAVVAIRFAWMLLRVNYERKDKSKIFIRSLPAKQGETLRSKVETLWIMLSIIYYLTAIREQAMHNHPMSQIRSVQQTIPQYAVIYAFAS